MTEGLEIEPVGQQHADALFRALDFDSVYHFITNPRPKDPGEVFARIERVNAGPTPESGQEWLNFVMLLDGQVIGRLEATVIGSSAEIAYLLTPPLAGKGYATEGVRWLIDYISGMHRMDEFWACTDPANLKSINLLNRCGFHETSLPDRGLLSYDEGDAVFHLQSGALRVTTEEWEKND